jgi:hypothetical protein
MLLFSSKPWLSGLIKQICNSLCDVDEESISDMLNEELSIDSDDEIIWKLKEKLVSVR